jgi:hypothetical protein
MSQDGNQKDLSVFAIVVSRLPPYAAFAPIVLLATTNSLLVGISTTTHYFT